MEINGTKVAVDIGTPGNIGDDNTSVTYRTRYIKQVKEVLRLVSLGHKIEWGATKNWLTINGESFNVNKQVYDFYKAHPECLYEDEIEDEE